MDTLRSEIIKNKRATQTAHSSILVPLMQNMVGGLSVSIILYFYLSGWTFLINAPFTGTVLVVGLVIAALFNIYRFFGDEIGLSAAIFWLGVQSGKLLCNEKATKEIATVINKSSLVNSGAETNALRLIVAHYEKNMKITAELAKAHLRLTRNEFEEAKQLLVNCGLLKSTKSNTLNAENQNKALIIFKEFKRK
jgi:hypothetical protein